MTDFDKAHLDIVAATHPGKTGKNNEDRYSVRAFLTGSHKELPSVFAILCDGIGGHQAGEIAAQMGVSLISEDIASSDGLDPLWALEKAIQHANHAIFEASLSEGGRKGMGATCACAWAIENRLYTTNLGDTRIYLLRGGHILQLTTDHTWLQEAYDAGILNETQAEMHPNAHVIRRYLGSAKKPQPDFRLWFFEGEEDAEAIENQGLALEPGDILLLCSDGLTDLVCDSEIQQVLKSTALEDAPAALINLANARGGHDNITVVLLRVPGGQALPAKRARKHRFWSNFLLAIILLGLLAVTIYYGLRWQGMRVETTSASTPGNTLPHATQSSGALFTVETATPVFDNKSTQDHEKSPTLTPWPTHTAVSE